VKEKEGFYCLVVFAPNLEVTFRVTADWAVRWCFGAFENETAVPAFPLNHGVFLEHFSLVYAFQQFQVPSFMVGFYFGDCSKGSGYFVESFLFSYVSKVRVERAPFQFFACCCSRQVFRC
jgi:hypothetical protein